MNAERSDFDRALRTWFEDGPTVMSDRVVDTIADRIARQPQRRSWRLPWRLQPMSNTIKLAAGLGAAIIVAVVAWQLLPGRDGGIGSPATPTPAVQPSAQPTATLEAVRDLPEGVVPPGRYQMAANGLSIVADIPAGWVGDPTPYLTSGEGFDEEQVLILFLNPDGLYSDACHWDLDGSGLASQPGDVEVGPTVDDLVDALRANTSYTSSTPSPITLGAYGGQTLELQLPGNDVLSTCDGEAEDRSDGHSYFVFPGAGVFAQGPDNRWQLFIVDVDGTRLVTLLSYFDSTPPADLEAARAIVESFEFTP